MKNIVSYVEYLSACVNAITKGFKECLNHWPVDSPFAQNKNSTNERKE